MRPPPLSRVRTLAAALAVLAAAQPVDAQRVVGRVLEQGGGGPVPGAMVRLASPTGLVGSGWLTAADGRFSLLAPAGGTYRLSVERIGFATTVVDSVTLAEGGIISLDVVVEAVPVALEGLRVEAEGGRCRVREGGADTQRLWDEARKALAAASWTESRVQLRFEVTVWDRQISPRTSQILFEEHERRETIGANSVQSLPPMELVEKGYVQTQPGYVFWYAPDARVLLSDEFLDTHCFQLAEREDDGVMYYGLGFEPDRERDLPDVSGVIWLDAATSRLDRVEFRYENVDMAGSSRARGEVRFAEMADGRWIVSDWFIQAPMTGGRLGTPAATRRGVQSVVHEVGNRVELVEGEGFMWQPDAPLGSITGTVYDSVSGGALAGAVVRLGGRGVRTRTRLDGSFDLEGLPQGLHRLTFAHPSLDSIGVTPGFTTVEVAEGSATPVTLAVPRWETMLAHSCAPDGAGALVGVVRTRQGRIIGGARVEVLDALTAEGQRFTDVSDAQGGYVICGLPPEVTRVSATRGRATSEPVEVRTSEERFVQADITLNPPPAVETAMVPGALQPAIVGTVLSQVGRTPLQDVMVQLLDDEGEPIDAALSDAEGRFRMLLERAAPVVYLSVERLGYTGAVSEALDLSNGTQRVEVLLPEEAIEIDPVMVVVDGRVPKLEQVGFYGRATTNPGLFIRRDDIEAVAPARTSDLLERAPGVRAWTDPMRGDLRRRIVFTRLTLSSGDRCFPSVFVDGEMTRIGGSREETEAPVIEGIEPPESADVPSLDELVPPQEIEAVEMYPTPGQVPRQFTGLGTRCGVIVIWTRRGAEGR